MTAAAVCAFLAVMPAAPAAAVTPCSRGNVALTFDDGPRDGPTGQILDTLRSKHAAATFFVVGENVAGHPDLARRALREGHVLANHSFRHEMLTQLSSAAVRSSLARTTAEIRGVGAPSPRLYRPPYGATSSRVRLAAAAVGLREVLWTVDAEDYRRGTTARGIADRVLSRLSPGAIVLMHDGIRNSVQTQAAVPRIIDGLRARGFCVGALGTSGAVLPPLPRISALSTAVHENSAGTSTTATVRLTLSEPSSRPVTLRASTRAGTATFADFGFVDTAVTFAPGSRSAELRVPVYGDELDEDDESFVIELTAPAGATLAQRTADVTIYDDDAPPRIDIDDVAVNEPSQGELTAKVRVSLSAPSGRAVQVHVLGSHQTTDNDDLRLPDVLTTFPAGVTEQYIDLGVLADNVKEPAETASVILDSAENAVLGRATATVTITDANGGTRSP